MSGAGSALMGIGSARGEDRSVAAAEMAISSPLLEASIDGAHGVLLSVAGGSDLGLFEINEAAQLVAEAAHPEANIIFGAVIDDALGDEVRVTVIAAGFDGGAPRPARQARRQAAEADQSQAARQPAADTINISSTGSGGPRPEFAGRPAAGRAPGEHAGDSVVPGHREAAPSSAPVAPPAPRRTIVFDDDVDDLDVPDFLK
jgi:cell division protein FtsZ